MTATPEPATPAADESERDDAEAVIDEEAASIDPRDPHAAAQIEGLIDDADELGLPTPEPAEVDPSDPAHR